MVSFEETDVKIIMGAFGNHLEGQDHRRREEQGRKSSLDEDDSKRKPKRGIGCLKEIGLGLIGFGVMFTLLGVFLFFERSFVAIGNILLLSGVTLTIGVMSTLQIFIKRQNFKGSASFAVGFVLIMLGWPVLGMIWETCGLLVLFSGFWPTVAVFLRKLPIVGGIFRQSSVFLFFPRNRVNMGKRMPI
ncbi:vesicle transport protein GOT1-like [Nicotiana sylvestris]|uniref:Vesicle transport protein GOT1B-like n=1 Tax=Nicotiana sylvestris TaxID=4096 RepID=A0A1U7VJV8_NICSY|nr:PREDICTED: vesicle transport protein GOT1B-like [Nicotiana sylvestris]